LNTNSEVVDSAANVHPLRWSELSGDLRDALTGKLTGLWGARSDEGAFDALAIDKQQALLLILSRLREKNLWQGVKQITNIYGEGGVGIEFTPWPMIESTLSRRKDFTRRLASHKDTTGGFYERDREEAALHFLYVDENPRKWYVHFDLYSPVYSAGSAFRHLRHEFIGEGKPDWRMILRRLKP
jgi:hypothetical protein